MLGQMWRVNLMPMNDARLVDAKKKRAKLGMESLQAAK